jgi:predicted nucleic acid-binding protein
MKVVLDTMLWVSYCTRRDGSRHRLIDRALKGRVRLFVSDYILGELADVLSEELNESRRFVHLTLRAVLRRAKRGIAEEHSRARAWRLQRRRRGSDGSFGQELTRKRMRKSWEDFGGPARHGR